MQKFIRSVIRWRSKHHLQKTKFQQYIDIFTNIPHEIVLIIIKHLDYNAHDIAALSSVRFFLYFPVFVNRKLRYHIKDNFLWYKLCLLYFPDNLSSEYGQTKDWMKIFRKLYWKNHTIVFAENIEEKELVSCGWFPKFGQFSDIKTDYAHPKIVRAIQESFEMDVKFESISPGIYEVVWEMNIYNLQRAQRFQFVTKIFQKNYDLVTIKEYSDTPSPEAFKRISDKGWFKYRAPKRIIIDKDQIISTKFIGHAKMCFSNPQEWPAPMALYCVYLKRYKNDRDYNKVLQRKSFINRLLHK